MKREERVRERKRIIVSGRVPNRKYHLTILSTSGLEKYIIQDRNQSKSLNPGLEDSSVGKVLAVQT